MLNWFRILLIAFLILLGAVAGLTNNHHAVGLLKWALFWMILMPLAGLSGAAAVFVAIYVRNKED